MDKIFLTIIAGFLLFAGCAQEQNAETAPQQQRQTFDWRGKPVKFDPQYEQSYSQSVELHPSKNNPGHKGTTSAPGTPDKTPQSTAAVLPSQALALLSSYVTANDPEKMYDEFLADTQKKLLTKEEFKKRIQDNYYRILQLVMTLTQEEPRYVHLDHSADRKQCSFTLHWSKRPKPKNGGEEALWGVGFRWEKNCWKLEQFRPEILAPLGD